METCAINMNCVQSYTMGTDINIDEQLLSSRGGVNINNLSSILNVANEENEINVVNHSPYCTIENAHLALNATKNGLKLLSLNAQSILAKFSSIEALIHALCEKDAEPDIFCIQESWLSDNADLSLIQLENYKCISQDYKCSAHGGLIIYIKSKYKFDKIEYNINSNIWEGLFMEITGDSLANKVIVGNIYKPPRNNNDNNNIQQFINEITPILQSYDSRKNDIMLAGDYNINLLKINERQLFADFLELMMTHSFFPKITLPTRFSMHSCSLLDNIFCKLSPNTIKTSSGIIHTGISDHFPYFVCIENPSPSKRNTTKLVPKKYNVEKARQAFLLDLESQDIYGMLNTNIDCNPNDNYAIFAKIMEETREKHFPNVLVKFNKHRHKDKKWITYGIINSITYRDKLHLKLTRTPVEDAEYNVHKHNLSVYNVILKKMIREAKMKYYTETFDKYKSDIKKHMENY